MEKKNEKIKIERPPVVVVMGHIDHGKSTLLDYIRKTNVVEDEAGNITQHISAYEVVHRDDGKDRKITFLDTPGHEAFSKMRERGANIADIAILMVSAEDGVKPQTLEAYKTITLNKVPFIVAINKIDKPGANVEKTKNELVENEIYLENYGGKVPSTEISAKTGAGIDNLLSLILILAEMENLTGVEEDLASGLVIEAHRDSKRGIETTLIIKNGTITKGMTVGVEDALCSTRIIENFKGEKVEKATFSSPIRLCGWDKMPTIGAEFKSFKNKKEAEKYAQNWRMESNSPINQKPEKETGKKIIGIVLKADVWGSIEAIEKEIGKIESESAEFKILQKGVGPISESDIKTVASSENALIVGFNVKADRSAVEIAEQRGISISSFDIIYKITEWLTEEMESRRPKSETV